MISWLALVVSLANPNVAAMMADGDAGEAPGLCLRTAALEKGMVAPCTGLLFSIAQARSAVSCVRADLPQCRADAKLEYTRMKAERDALLIKIAAADSTASIAEPASSWRVIGAGASGVVVGVLIGLLVTAF